MTAPTPTVLAFDGTPPLVKVETLQEKADRIAIENKISTTTFSNLIWSESRWQTDLTSKEGDIGITQINPYFHPEVTKGCALDPDCAMEWTAKFLAKGNSYQYVVCNCYAYMKTKVKRLPRMAEIMPNSKPKIGAVAIFKYKDGTKHLAYVKGLQSGIIQVEEANYKPCLTGSRQISADDPRLIGFYYPEKVE